MGDDDPRAAATSVRSGIYIAFEGGEGSGKSTQARLLADRLDGVLTREPGGTALGSSLRRLLLERGSAPVGARAEALLMAADRAQHIDEVVHPALRSGRHVVSDRSLYSSLAYQGGARGLGVDEVRRLNHWAVAGCVPDVVILLDLSRTVARGRLGASLDRLEGEGEEFHDEVARTFRVLADADPERWVVLPAQGPADEVAAAVWSAVEHRLERTPPEPPAGGSCR